MKILIVSYESWRDSNNGGNVLSNIFSAFPETSIAQVYCSGELPQNGVCQKYFQISDGMLLTRSRGRELEVRPYFSDEPGREGAVENQIKKCLPAVFREAAMLARELLWVYPGWKTRELERFVTTFQPDLIFAPCYSFFHVSKLALHIKQIAGCPMISYISDDNYSMKQLCISPSFWVNRLLTRKWIRRHFSESALVYTMTDLQKQEYEAMFGRPMKVLCKSADFEIRRRHNSLPLQFIYAGGLYLNRWKVLAVLAEAIRELNKEKMQAQLHIYSSSKLREWQEKRLHDGKHSFLHGQVSYRELVERYRDSDVAVHVESFDLKNRLITRLSFSTKIIDCMSSGCAILAIGPGTQAGISYLKTNDAAICVDDIKKLSAAVRDLTEHTELIAEYADKAYRLGKKNHHKRDIDAELWRDFCEIAAQEDTP